MPAGKKTTPKPLEARNLRKSMGLRLTSATVWSIVVVASLNPNTLIHSGESRTRLGKRTPSFFAQI